MGLGEHAVSVRDQARQAVTLRHRAGLRWVARWPELEHGPVGTWN
jgi:hypothetical protein